jgi:hypothetical protein
MKTASSRNRFKRCEQNGRSDHPSRGKNSGEGVLPQPPSTYEADQRYHYAYREDSEHRVGAPPRGPALAAIQE